MKARTYATRWCRHCGAAFKPLSASSRLCRDCVDPEDGMRWRATIRLYGVDKFMWDAMYFEQGGVCLVCGIREATAVDHCHTSGRVRGLLCLGCNTLLGFMEIPGRLEAALNYIESSD